MQEKARLERLSRFRLDLRQLLKDLETTVEVVFDRGPLVRGNVYEIARRCGTDNCACTRGRLHRNMVLTWSEKGKHRLLSIPKNKLESLKRKSEEYLRFRRARAQVTVLYNKMLAVIDRIESLRREEP